MYMRKMCRRGKGGYKGINGLDGHALPLYQRIDILQLLLGFVAVEVSKGRA